MIAPTVILHAGLIALWADGGWRGALIIGSSGTGKSDLMLRSMDCGFRLVADDRTLVWASRGRLFGRAPDTLHGLIELRGVGILAERALPFAETRLVIRCEPPETSIERAPDEVTQEIAGLHLPALSLHALDASAPAKISRSLMRLGQTRGEA